jgi:diguanylate cyclase (GGDEF)-like protein
MDAINNDSVLIQKTALFSSLSPSEIDFIAGRCGTLKLSKGAALFSPDEEAKHFYILKSGAIRVYKTRDNGSEDEMAKFTVGDTIGDFDFARGAEYDANAEASEDSILIEFPGYGHTIDSLAAENPNTICNILMNAIVMMTDRIKSINKLILENMSWVQELHRRAYEDSSTGLWKQALLTDEIVAGLKNPSALIMMKPDRFKVLVDTRGHHAGDEAMIRIAIIMKKMTRKFGLGWAIRFKSNETGMIFYNCNSIQAEKIAEALAQEIVAMEPVPSQNEIPAFSFSASVSWSVWPKDDPNWESFFNGTYAALMDTWRNNQGIFHYSKMIDNG